MSNLPYTVTFYERDHPTRTLTAQLADTPPTPSGGGGGHQVITLPKRAAVTIWQGRDQPMLMDLPVLLGDGRGPVFAGQTALLKMWRPDDEMDEPPVIKLRSTGSAVPFQQLPWVVTNLLWGNAQGEVQGDEAGNRVLQKLTVSLTEYRADERLQIVKIKHRKHERRHRTHRVKHGENLTKIARNYQVAGGWQEVGQAQSPPILDPRQITVGEILQIP